MPRKNRQQPRARRTRRLLIGGTLITVANLLIAWNPSREGNEA